MIILPFILDKLGDNKFAESLKIIIDQLIQKIPPKFFIGQILKYIKPN